MKKEEIRVDEELIKQVEPILKEMGLTVEKAVELYFKEIIRCGKIPFSLDESKPRSFKELVAGFDGEYQSEEWDTGKPVGREVW
ncbi:MAG: type II toxin-antitoxin system RelB/DinJ family antitoxin [Lysinibacillus sp.]